jgi:hypothetical protein
LIPIFTVALMQECPVIECNCYRCPSEEFFDHTMSILSPCFR